MIRRRLPGIAAAVLAPMLLAGCAADQLSTQAATTSRMTKPSVIPEVEDSATASDPPDFSDPTTQYMSVPEQIWVRSASYGDRRYRLTIATAAGGTFNLVDGRALGGMTLGQSEDTTCGITHDEHLPTPIPGAITNVTRLVTLNCPAPRMSMPAVQGEWNGQNEGGGTSAIFTLGGPSAQGKPLDAEGTTTIPPVKQDVQVVSVVHHGATTDVRVWATEYVGLSIDPASTSPTSTAQAPDPQCSTKALPQSRPGVTVPARQRLFEILCTAMPRLDDYQLSATQASGALGHELVYDGRSVPLKPAPLNAGD